MTCHEARELLLDYLEGALDEVAEVRLLQHLRNCAACDYELRRQPSGETEMPAMSPASAARRTRLIDLLASSYD